MAVHGLARLTTGPAGAREILAWRAARSTPVKGAFVWGERD